MNASPNASPEPLGAPMASREASPQPPPPAAGPPSPVGAEARSSAGWYPERPAPRRKSPVLACLLSLVPGLGQVYVGYYMLGFIHAIVVASLFTLLVFETVEELMPFLVVFLVFFMLYNIVDAGRRAAFYNQMLAGVPAVELPSDLTLPRPGGSIFGGAALLGIGFILLLNTAFGVSLDWVQSWWPLAPMIFGAWLLFRAIQDKSAKK